MAKSKSSASSATRKKHAKKALTSEAPEAAEASSSTATQPGQPAQRGQKKVKKSRFEPKIKSYIPPPAAPKGAPDPVDLYLNGGKGVNPELVVILRRLGKRDEGTISKGVEGLDGWIREVMHLEASKVEEGDEWKVEGKQEEVVNSLAVWAHHFPRLSLHPSRRLRLQSHALHTLLTSQPHRPSPLLKLTRSALLTSLWLDQKEYVGAWCCSAFDGDRAVRSVARRSWDAVVLISNATETSNKEGIPLQSHAEPILEFARDLVIASPVDSSSSSPDAAAEDPTLLKTQALLTIAYLLNTLPSPLYIPLPALNFLVSPDLWLLAKPDEPAALRRAVYEVLGAAVGRKEDDLLSPENGVQVIASRVLRFCWEEDEGWAGVIAFLRRYPEAWTLADQEIPQAPAEEEGGDEDDEDDDASLSSNDEEEESPKLPAVPEASTSGFTPFPTLSLLFTHLSLACTGHPQSYPTILLLLSTLPSSVLPPTHDALSTLFEAFWSAWGGRALAVGMIGSINTSGPTAIEEFVGALLECVLWMVGAAQKNQEEVEGANVAEEIVTEWIGRVWSTYLGLGENGKKSHKGIATPRVAELIGNALAKLAARDEALFLPPWIVIRGTSTEALSTSFTRSFTPLSTALVSFSSLTSGSLHAQTLFLTGELVQIAVEEIEKNVEGANVASFLSFVEEVRPVVAEDPTTIALLDQLATNHIAALLSSTATDSSLQFLTHQLPSTSIEAQRSIWASLFSTPLPSPVLLQLVQVVGLGTLPSGLPTAGLDALITESTGRLLGDQPLDVLALVELEIVKLLVARPEPFVSTTVVEDIVHLVTQRLDTLAHQALSSTRPVLSRLLAPTIILSSYTENIENARTLVSNGDGTTAIFDIARLLPLCRLGDDNLSNETSLAAEKSWSAITAVGGEVLARHVLTHLTDYLVDPLISASPIEVTNAAVSLLSTLPSSINLNLSILLPSRSSFDSLFANLQLSRPAPSLSIIDPLIPQHPDDEGNPKPTNLADEAGLGAYVRGVLAILEVSFRSRSFPKHNLWVLPHVLFVSDSARDQIAAARSHSGLFGKQVERGVVQRIVSATDGFSSYLLSSITSDLPADWHTTAAARLKAKESVVVDSEDLLSILDGLARRARLPAEVYARRAFLTVLRAALEYTDATILDAERWLAYAQSLPEGSELARAIILAIKATLAESPRFVRYQNELASIIAGIPSSSASQRGLNLLRMLLATAPPLDAPIIFLPQQRTMFLIQRIQVWIGSDDDLVEEIHSRITELFLHLAPIVQELSGSHWDLIFDIIESNLETTSWEEDSSFPALYYSCKLLAQIKDLATSNAELRSTAKGRLDKSLELVRDLFVSRPDSRDHSAPRLLILDIMATLVSDIPSKLLKMGTSFDQLIRLLQDPSFLVQQSSYNLVVRIAEKYVTDLVVEVELDSESTIAIELPQDLIKLLSIKLPTDILENPDQFPLISTYFLAWLVAFRFFDNASPQIKSAYLDQLRRLDLVATSLLPSLFLLLNLGERGRYFDVAPWAVDDFQLDLMTSLDSITIPVFASFVYYRSLQALPSLIRSYWESCKNRQLSMAISSFTSRYFSPVLIAHELAHLKDPDDPIGKSLRDNPDFTVKVAVGANEVKAIYVVDEQNMEIGIRLPSEFPLVGVEVKDVRKVGVTDAQWRAWLLAVQQVVSAQNGLIADALSLFKRNVALHFEGVEACAICYSVISVVDRSLPTKGCRTCHNRFHAGCLYKWFSTSHGSSCPLCRSLF